MNAHRNVPAWLEDCVISGLQRLLILRLRNSPANDTINAVADVWLEVFMSARCWERDRDTPRLRTAFGKVTAEVDAWPSPAQVLKALPPLKPQPMLPEPDPVIDAEHIRRCQARIAEAQKHVFKRMNRRNKHANATK